MHSELRGWVKESKEREEDDDKEEVEQEESKIREN